MERKQVAHFMFHSVPALTSLFMGRPEKKVVVQKYVSALARIGGEAIASNCSTDGLMSC